MRSRTRALLAAALLPLLVLGGGPAAGAATAVRGAWRWPVEVAPQVIRPFIAPPAAWAAGHRGVDLAAGAALIAPADGVVRYAGQVVDRGVLSIDHGDGVVSSFEPVTALVSSGDRVLAGQVVATVEGGHCSTPCVHMGVRVDGGYRNPLLWLGGVPYPVLLPTRSLD